MAILTSSSPRLLQAPCGCRRRQDRCAFLGVLLVSVVGWIAGTSPGIADEPAVSEYQVKSAFLINFPKYLDWPATAFADTNSNIVIAVLGESKIIGELKKVIAGRMVGGRKLVLKQLASGEETGVCHILFISATEQQHSPNPNAILNRDGVLTVGESDSFLERGGIINLTRRDQKVALEVNLAAAGKARIKISSSLLRVAVVVKGKAN